jgi:predicted nucleic acid-binding protein
MNYVLDACVAVASLRPNEPSYSAAVARVTPLIRGTEAIVVPSIFQVEVGSALTRAGFTAAEVERFVSGFLANATIVTIGPERARRAQRIAMTTRLRAVDAIYVWLAARERLPLVTLDREIFERGRALCDVVAP